MVHSNAKNIILLLVDTHWGEVDWILPVLHKIREKKKDIRLVAIFSSKKLFDKRENQLTLYNKLFEYTDEIIYPNPKNIITKTNCDDKLDREEKKQPIEDANLENYHSICMRLSKLRK